MHSGLMRYQLAGPRAGDVARRIYWMEYSRRTVVGRGDGGSGNDFGHGVCERLDRAR